MKTFNQLLTSDNPDVLAIERELKWLEKQGFDVSLHFDQDGLPHLTIQKAENPLLEFLSKIPFDKE